MTSRERWLSVGVAFMLLAGIGTATTVNPSSPRLAHSAGGSPSPTPSMSPTPAVATSARPSPAISFVAPTTRAPSRTPTPRSQLSWHACEGGVFQCATLPVPLDRSNPRSGTIALALIRLPAAEPAHRIGSLLVNPGGPGASGFDFVRDEAPLALSHTLRARFDVVGFDPRGVSRSAGVHCEDSGALGRLFHADPQPQTMAARQDYAQQTQALVDGCQRRSGSELAHIGTVEAATDMDAIRRALGERTISYLGFSYGTYLGATWLDMFPGTVRAAVLDGPLDPGMDLTQFVSDQGVAFDQELTRWFAWCDASPGCSFRSPTAGTADSAARFDQLAAQIKSQPLSVAGGRSLGFGEFQYGVGYGMYSRSLWKQLGDALSSAATGSGAGLLTMSDTYLSRSADGHYDDSFEANTAINCLDHRGPRTEQGWYDAATATAAKAPRLGFSIVYTTLACATWPVPARAARIPTGIGAPPVVIVGGRHDPATPYAWAVALAKDLRGSRLISRVRDSFGDGHTSYGGQSPCTVSYVDAYLINGTLPPKGATC